MIPIRQPTRKGDYVQLEECKPGKHDKRKNLKRISIGLHLIAKRELIGSIRKKNQLRATEIHTLSRTPISY
jgi:hypothetical protein